MKNLFIRSVIAVIALSFVACNKYGRTTAKRTVIDGKVTNMQVFPDAKEFTLKVVDFGGTPTTYTELYIRWYF
jgi:hypothetical protein